MDLATTEVSLAADAERQAARCKYAGAWRDLSNARLTFNRQPTMLGLRALRLAHYVAMGVEHAMLGLEFELRNEVQAVPEPSHDDFPARTPRYIRLARVAAIKAVQEVLTEGDLSADRIIQLVDDLDRDLDTIG